MNLLIFSNKKQGRIRQLIERQYEETKCFDDPPTIAYAPLPDNAPAQFIEERVEAFLPDAIIIEHTPTFNTACFKALFDALHEKFPLSLPYVYLLSTADEFFSEFGSALRKSVFYLPGRRRMAVSDTGIPLLRFQKKRMASSLKQSAFKILNDAYGRYKTAPFRRFKNKTTSGHAVSVEQPATRHTNSAEIDPKLWRFMKIECPYNQYFHHVELSDTDRQNGPAADAFHIKLTDPQIQQSMSEVFLKKKPVISRNTRFLPVQVAAHDGVFELCRRILDRLSISDHVLFAQKRCEYDCPDVFDIIGVNPDISIFRLFKEVKSIQLLPEEIQSIITCAQFPDTIGDEEESMSLVFQYQSLQRQRRALQTKSQKKQFSDELNVQGYDLALKAKTTLALLRRIYESMRVFHADELTSFQTIPGDILVVGHDQTSVADILRQTGKTKHFTWLNMSEFTDWESLAAFNIASYANVIDNPILTDRATYQKMRMQLNRFTMDIDAVQNREDPEGNHTHPDPTNDDTTLKKKSALCLFTLFSSCLNRLISVNADKIRREKAVFTEKKQFERLKNPALPGLIMSNATVTEEFIKSALPDVLPNFGGEGSLTAALKNIPPTKNDHAGSQDIFKTMIRRKLKNFEPALGLRYVVVQDDVHIIKLILDIVQNKIDPFLPVIALVEGTINRDDITFLKKTGYPILYGGCYTLEDSASFTEKLNRAFSVYVPI